MSTIAIKNSERNNVLAEKKKDIGLLLKCRVEKTERICIIEVTP